MNSNEILNQLNLFTGSEHLYQYNSILITDGIKYLCETCNSYWLLDVLISHQIFPKVNSETFQVWTITLKPIFNFPNACEVTCNDGNDNILATQVIPFTDFPFSYSFYFIDGIVLLKSEY
ncbi:MAG: hypothetical protein MK105_13635 [Crocinitomicaceae bacterium]|nr:hypothetical protein [Crocinitomicaceae bacterium]